MDVNSASGYATPMTRLHMSVALVIALAGTARAGGFGIPEYGVRRTAMAAVIGRPDELSCIYHNPAGLVLSDQWRFYISAGLSLLSTEFELAPWDESNDLLGVTPEASGYYKPVKPQRAFGVIPMIAVGGPIRQVDKLYAGAALYVGNATGAKFDKNAVTHYHLIDGYIVAPQLTVAAAYKLRDDLAVAATAGVIYFKVHGRRYVYPILMGTDVRSLTGTKPDLVLDGSAWAPIWSVGVYGKPHPRITYGAAIFGRVDATLEGPINVTFDQDATNPGDKLTGTQHTGQMLPWTAQAGVNVDVAPTVEIGTELRYWLYRQYKRQHTDIDGIQILRQLHTENNSNDSWEISGGVRVHDLAAAPGLELMAGAHYDRTPAPTKTVTLDQPSFSHIGLHSGARYSFGRYTLGASYIHYWYQVPTITDSATTPPSNVRGHGTNNIFSLSMEARL
jgi:long-subunit fatty acid transport protein